MTHYRWILTLFPTTEKEDLETNTTLKVLHSMISKRPTNKTSMSSDVLEFPLDKAGL